MRKLYYSISEVAEIVGEQQHILRYWEKEFPLLKPKKNRAGNRIYSDKDLEIVKAIKTMLREQKLSVRGTLDELNKMFGKKVNISSEQSKIGFQKVKKDEINQIINLPKQMSFDFDEEFKINLMDIRNKLKNVLNVLKDL
ncbi:MAG: MerR family transcriptional regulator [Ignavibacteria bacterium]|nr:MerR family transcriptional regulator [Ignavibacteria bacterium]